MLNLEGNLFTFWLKVLFVLYKTQFMKFISMHKKANSQLLFTKKLSFSFSHYDI